MKYINTNRHQPSPTVTNRHQLSPIVTNHHLPSPTQHKTTTMFWVHRTQKNSRLTKNFLVQATHRSAASVQAVRSPIEALGPVVQMDVTGSTSTLQGFTIYQLVWMISQWNNSSIICITDNTESFYVCPGRITIWHMQVVRNAVRGVIGLHSIPPHNCDSCLFLPSRLLRSVLRDLSCNTWKNGTSAYTDWDIFGKLHEASAIFSPWSFS